MDKFVGRQPLSRETFFSSTQTLCNRLRFSADPTKLTSGAIEILKSVTFKRFHPGKHYKFLGVI